MSLGCMEIIYRELNLKADRQELLSFFGQKWTVTDIVRYLADYGYVLVPGPARDGDIIFQNNHPGIVRGKKVENIMRGRNCFWPLRRLYPEVILRRS